MKIPTAHLERIQQIASPSSFPYEAPPDGATGEGEEHVSESSGHVPRRAIFRGPGHAFEPLISSLDAAKLLGNIHVKTLQRYARRGNLPGYQIGGHWYFRASDLDSWLRTQLNSSCHPCRLPKEAK